MYCPTCGQQQAAENVRFCSRCGFLLTGVSDVIANNGLLPNQSNEIETPVKDSPRKRGIKQGVMTLLIGLLLVTPILIVISIALNVREPYVVAIAAIISFFGGIIRIIYAQMFEEAAPKQMGPGNIQKLINQQVLAGNQAQNVLPASTAIPANEYVTPKTGRWMTTNELADPGSITDHTTKFLEKEEEK
jgi:hypothetical protein